MIDSVLLGSISLLNVSNGITRTTCEICSKLAIKATVVFIVNFEEILQIVLIFSL